MWRARGTGALLLLASAVYLLGCARTGGRGSATSAGAPPGEAAAPPPAPQRVERVLFLSCRVDRDGEKPPPDAVRLFSMNADGSDAKPVFDKWTAYGEMTWSPDGTRFAWVAGRDLLVASSSDPHAENLTNRGVDVTSPAWSPDGRSLAFVSWCDGNQEVYTVPAGGGAATNLTQSAAREFQPTWSPDGTRIALVSNRDGAWQVYTVHSDGGNVHRVSNSHHGAQTPAWSADGQRLAFQSITKPAVAGALLDAGGAVVPVLWQGFAMQVDGGVGDSDVQVADTSSPEANVVATLKHCYRPKWSPTDPALLVFTLEDTDIRVARANSSSATDFARPGCRVSEAVWSPDGQSVAVALSKSGAKDGEFGEVWALTWGGSPPRCVAKGVPQPTCLAWSSDGSCLWFCAGRTDRELYSVPAEGGEPRNMTNSRGRDWGPVWVP